MIRRFGLVFLFLFSALVLAACGGPKGNEPSNEMHVVTTDFHFTPDSFTVEAGNEISLELKNDGNVKHELVIIKLGMEPTVPWGEDDQEKVYWEHEAEPGETVNVTFTAPEEPGEYLVLCGIEGHLEAGMKGKLTVVGE